MSTKGEPKIERDVATSSINPDEGLDAAGASPLVGRCADPSAGREAERFQRTAAMIAAQAAASQIALRPCMAESYPKGGFVIPSMEIRNSRLRQRDDATLGERGVSQDSDLLEGRPDRSGLVLWPVWFLKNTSALARKRDGHRASRLDDEGRFAKERRLTDGPEDPRFQRRAEAARIKRNR